jgi:hypothetical protein
MEMPHAKERHALAARPRPIAKEPTGEHEPPLLGTIIWVRDSPCT